MRDERELNSVIERYADTVKRVCVLYLKNNADTEEIFQNVFIKFYNHTGDFESEEHLKAWLIRVSINESKNLLKSLFRRRTESLDLAKDLGHTDDYDENEYVRNAVSALPHKYKSVIYLHYFEGYSAVEISKILKKNVNTIYTNLARGRNMLKDILGGEHE